jgi:homoserine O-acetyltransferase/O-succinyltransferase
MKHESTFYFNESFQLELGGYLPGFQLHYTTLGKLNSTRDNVVWVCHALTGNSDVTAWWPSLFTEEGVFNPEEYFIVCANILGSAYGSTNAFSINPENDKTYFHDFPTLTNRDVVRAFDLLRRSLGIYSVHTLIGGSLGGQQVLEWAIQEPDVFEHIVPIATNAQHSPWGIAFNEAQRMAIAADASWKTNDYLAGTEGLKAARAIGMISYRTYDTFQKTQAEQTDETIEDFKAATYQRHQGLKLSKRFNAFSYWALSKMMDSHQVGRDRGGVEAALRKIKARTLVVGIDSDLLFPIHEQLLLADKIYHADIAILQSLYGHDGFLVEFEQLNKSLKNFYINNPLLSGGVPPHLSGRDGKNIR